jgi:hypothetical protein
MDSECHSIVIEYLMHNCFKNTAKALMKETNKLEQCIKTGRASKSKEIFILHTFRKSAEILKLIASTSFFEL